jgi:hypothetical protein
MPTRKFSDAAKSALLFVLICLAVEACSERVRNSGGGPIRGGWNPPASGERAGKKSHVVTPEYLGGF